MLGTNPRELFHATNPHPALSPVPLDEEPSFALEQMANEAVWRQLLIQATLSLLLPPEDLANPCLRILLTEILSELIIGNAICGKLCEGWFIWEIIIKLIDVVQPTGDSVEHLVSPVTIPSRLEQFGLVSSEETEDASSSEKSGTGFFDVVFLAFCYTVWFTTILFSGIRAIATSITVSANLPPRVAHMKPSSPSSIKGFSSISSTYSGEQPCHQDFAALVDPRPIIGMSAWSCSFRILSLDLRMPWLSAFWGFLQWLSICGPGKVGCTNSRLDR